MQLAESQIKYTSDNPIYINLLEQKRELELQKKNIETRIGKLPLAQQEYIDLFRNLELSQNLYTELMNRKLNFSIQEASTIGNISVIDNAYIDYIVSPRFVDIFTAFVFSIFIAILTAVIRFFFFIKLQILLSYKIMVFIRLFMVSYLILMKMKMIQTTTTMQKYKISANL